MVDRQNVPRPAPELGEDGIPSIAEIPGDVLLTEDPPEVRLAREEPDFGLEETYVDRQFLEPGAEGGLGDDVDDLIGDFGVSLDDTLTAEEAAMRIVEEPGGMNYDPDPGYVDHD